MQSHFLPRLRHDRQHGSSLKSNCGSRKILLSYAQSLRSNREHHRLGKAHGLLKQLCQPDLHRASLSHHQICFPTPVLRQQK